MGPLSNCSSEHLGLEGTEDLPGTIPVKDQPSRLPPILLLSVIELPSPPPTAAVELQLQVILAAALLRPNTPVVEHQLLTTQVGGLLHQELLLDLQDPGMPQVEPLLTPALQIVS